MRTMMLFTPSLKKRDPTVLNFLRVNVLDDGFIHTDSRWYHQEIESPFSRLYFIIAGQGLIQGKTTQRGQTGDIDNDTMPLLPGHIYLIPTGTTYTYSCAREIRKYYFHLRVELIPGRDIFELLPKAIEINGTEEDFDLLRSSFESNALKSHCRRKALILKIAGLFLNNCDAKTESVFQLHYRFKNFFARMTSLPYLPISDKEVRSLTGKGYKSFNKSCKKTLGLTIRQYQQSLLVQKAKEELVLTQVLIKELAYSLGFRDEFYFSRMFKKHTGLSPDEYRKKNTMVRGGYYG